jgi:predicted membrane protein
VTRIFAVLGVAAVVFMAAAMLVTANAYLWENPTWAWGLILAASLGLLANALTKPHAAFSRPAILVSILIGLGLSWPAMFRGDSWWLAWLGLGIMMPLLACFLLRSFSLAFRTD